MRRPVFLCALSLIASLAGLARAAEPVQLLFVGNSYTFGRVDPVMTYNSAAVHDLTAGFNFANPAGTNSHPAGTSGAGGSFEPHPWGGVAGIFKKMTDEAGLSYDVSLSTRNAASLRGHFLETYNADWKLRGNVASRRWDVVVLQDQSDVALPPGKSRNANLGLFNLYVDQFERFIHEGTATSFRESDLLGGLTACMAAGLSQGNCNIARTIPANPNASQATKVFLEQTWARPDMVEPHLATRADISTVDGRPKAENTAATLYYPTLAAMTADLHDALQAKAAANPRLAGVVPVGDAFQRAVDQGLAQGKGFYNPNGTWTETPGALDLWWLDRTHASKYGSYLSALTLFGAITGRDPLTLGPEEQAAVDLGIAPSTAVALQRVASQQLGLVGAEDLSPGMRPGSMPAR